jgi:glycosyltransferase involved in cell wall biosynthesis
MKTKPRIAIVTPFLDKRHGTERCIAEQIERLCETFDVHIYSTMLEDIDTSRVTWHRISRLPGPHIAGYLWFAGSNHVRRLWDRQFRGLCFDVVLSPGINCLDADIISIHILFDSLRQRSGERLGLQGRPIGLWPKLLYRQLSYLVFAALEHRIYANRDLPLVVPSRRIAEELAENFGRTEDVKILSHGIDPKRFNVRMRHQLRSEARNSFSISTQEFVLLLIGNDLNNKGVSSLVEAVATLPSSDIRIIVAGEDNPSHYCSLLGKYNLIHQVQFLGSRPDVEFFYAAADAYVGPSLEDAFALPPLEAMACGLPVIVSRQTGVSELITHGVDGLILENPRDSMELARLISLIERNVQLRQRLGKSAAETALQYTWDRNGSELTAIIQEIIKRKTQAAVQTLAGAF